MKILFTIFHGFDPNNGISKKISYQIEAFRSLGHEVHICYMDETGNKKRMIDNAVIADYGTGIISKIKKRIEFSSVVKFTNENNIDLVYIRSNHNANLFTTNMVKRMRKSGVKVVMEIPTYPYDSEYANTPMATQIIQDKIFRKRLAHNLDAIVTFSDDDFIFGQRTIRISNGIDFNHVKLNTAIHDTTHELNLIGVAEIHRWHGFDRVIKGLAQYYSKQRSYIVKFHVVGYFFADSIETEFKSIIQKYNMEDYVCIHGKKHGQELDEVFNKCDFGIGSLGRHRVGIKKMKTLKNREYAARGIPFTYSENDEDFDNMPYVLKMPADESPVDIGAIVEFHKNLSISPQEIRNSIKELSWTCQMEKVIQRIYPVTKRNKPLGIAYCIPLLDRPSGMEKVLTTKANYLAENMGYDITIITTDDKDSIPYFPLSKRIKLIQLDIDIDKLWKFPIYKRVYLYYRKLREYRKKMEITLMNVRPDITVTLMRREINFINDIKDGSIKIGEIHFGRYKYREASFKHVPAFINNWISSLWMLQLDKNAKRLKKFIVLTQEDVINWKGYNNIEVISNPITIDSIKKTKCKHKQAIVVGRYTYQKGLDMLIQAWGIVFQKHPDWILHIYGAGDKETYESLIKEKGLTNVIKCHEATQNIINKYLESSLYIMSSRYEGLPLVLMEAMSVGLPCVSFACPCGPRDIIHDGEDGILCENGNIQALAEGICKLIEDESLRKEMGRKAAINIQRYNLDNIMQQWDRLFKEVIKERS